MITDTATRPNIASTIRLLRIIYLLKRVGTVEYWLRSAHCALPSHNYLREICAKIRTNDHGCTLKLSINKHVDSPGYRAVSINGERSRDVLRRGVSGNSADLASGDITRCILMKAADSCGREPTARSENASRLSVSPLPRPPCTGAILLPPPANRR